MRVAEEYYGDRNWNSISPVVVVVFASFSLYLHLLLAYILHGNSYDYDSAKKPHRVLFVAHGHLNHWNAMWLYFTPITLAECTINVAYHTLCDQLCTSCFREMTHGNYLKLRGRLTVSPKYNKDNVLPPPPSFSTSSPGSVSFPLTSLQTRGLPKYPPNVPLHLLPRQ